jgi:hypothetical protein
MHGRYRYYDVTKVYTHIFFTHFITYSVKLSLLLHAETINSCSKHCHLELFDE